MKREDNIKESKVAIAGVISFLLLPIMIIISCVVPHKSYPDNMAQMLLFLFSVIIPAIFTVILAFACHGKNGVLVKICCALGIICAVPAFFGAIAVPYLVYTAFH